jgi:hypothetical protein
MQLTTHQRQLLTNTRTLFERVGLEVTQDDNEVIGLSDPDNIVSAQAIAGGAMAYWVGPATWEIRDFPAFAAVVELLYGMRGR